MERLLEPRKVVHNMRERFVDLIIFVATNKAFYELAKERDCDLELIVHHHKCLERAEDRLREFYDFVDYLELDKPHERLVYGRKRAKLIKWLTKRYKKKYGGY